MKGVYLVTGFILGSIAGAIGFKYYLDKKNDVEYPDETPVLVSDPGPEEDDPEENEEFQHFMADVEDQNEDSKLPPEVLTESDMQDMPDKEVIDFIYYNKDGVVVDMQDNSMINPEDVHRFLGDCLDSSGFSSNDSEVLYVHNHSHDVIYCVNKVEAEWDPYGGVNE